MRLIFVGCEYAGKTTLSKEVTEWIGRTMGGGRTFHDHFTVPSPELEGGDRDLLANATPRFKEMFQRYQIEYHLQDAFYGDPDHLLAGFHIEEAVYAPLYYGYGGKGEYAERALFARSMERRIMETAPDTVLVLLKATPKVIKRRMKESPHTIQVVPEADVEMVLSRFEDEYRDTWIRKRFVLDTSTATVEQTLQEFEDNIKNHLSDADRMRILVKNVL